MYTKMQTRMRVAIYVFIAIILLYSPIKHALSSPTPIQVKLATQNVFQDSLSTEWNQIKQVIDPQHTQEQYLLTSFQMLYTKQGEIISLHLTFTAQRSDGVQEDYALYHEQGVSHDNIIVSESDPQVPVQERIDMDSLFKQLSPHILKLISPTDDNAVQLNVQEHFVNITTTTYQNPPKMYYILRNNTLTGPSHVGSGYLINIFSMNKTGPAAYESTSERNILIGGQ